MELRDFFLKYEISEQGSASNACEGCQVEKLECGQFSGCPLPLGYIFVKKRGLLKKVTFYV